MKEVHGLVALLHKGGGSTDRASDYRPVVLLNSLFQLISYIIQEYGCSAGVGDLTDSV